MPSGGGGNGKWLVPLLSDCTSFALQLSLAILSSKEFRRQLVPRLPYPSFPCWIPWLCRHVLRRGGLQGGDVQGGCLKSLLLATSCVDVIRHRARGCQVLQQGSLLLLWNPLQLCRIQEAGQHGIFIDLFQIALMHIQIEGKAQSAFCQQKL